MKSTKKIDKNASASDILLKISLSKPIVPKDVSLIYLKHRRKLQLHRAKVPVSHVKEYLSQHAASHVRVKTEFDLLYEFPKRNIEKLREARMAPFVERENRNEGYTSSESWERLMRLSSKSLRRKMMSKSEDFYLALEAEGHLQHQKPDRLQISQKITTSELKNSSRGSHLSTASRRIPRDVFLTRPQVELKHRRTMSATFIKARGRRDVDTL
jgi:hypothetical protein